MLVREERKNEMRYTKKERLEIGKKMYDEAISYNRAAETFGVSRSSARNYLRLYCDEYGLTPKKSVRKADYGNRLLSDKHEPTSLADYESMTKEELIFELVKSKIAQARLKKICGEEVVGEK